MRRTPFEARITIERGFARDLRKLSRSIKQIIQSHVTNDLQVNCGAMMEALTQYSFLIHPWAQQISESYLKHVNRSNLKDWESAAVDLGHGLREMLYGRDIGHVIQWMHHDQVELIKTIPLQAGERIQGLAMEYAITGKRANELAQRIAETEQVSNSIATRIARTEIAKANSMMTQARALAIGVETYTWRTVGDRMLGHRTRK